jgi:hypothetical protein
LFLDVCSSSERIHTSKRAFDYHLTLSRTSPQNIS